MRRFLTVTLLAIGLIYGCVQGALWQFDRYEVRHAKNELIRNNISLPPLDEEALQSLQPSEIAFRKISVKGSFVPEKEILVRNRYFEGKYGFGVLTLFESENGKKYWVDRGWVIAGKDALTPPAVQPVTNENVLITAYARVENLESQVRGSVVALPSKAASQLQAWNKEQAIQTEPIYFDLIEASNSSFTPSVPTSLPELSDGPHLAYSFQWVLFIFLVAFAWYLVIREDRKAHPTKL
ncbi:MAG: SURF1 family protein [Actinomycetota bacterium]